MEINKKKILLTLLDLQKHIHSNNADILTCISLLCKKSHITLPVKLRGPYNISMYNPTISAIICGHEVLTKRHIRVTAKSFTLLVSYFPRKFQGWSIEIEVAVFLYWLACGTSYRAVSMAFSMPTTTVFDIIKKYLELMIILAPKVIQFPTPEELPEMGEQFAKRAKSMAFNRAVGSIDGCHIRVLCPPTLHDQYINRKLFYSIQLQGVCDADSYFMDAYAGFPGSVHDMRVLKHSPIYLKGNFPPDGYYLLGDSGYANRLRPIPIITPFKGSNLTAQQTRFNKHHSSGRTIIERVFGMMKARWRSIFTKALEVKLAKAVKVIAACTVMHNICVSAGDLIQPEKLNEHNKLPASWDERDWDEVDATLLREQIMSTI